MLSTKMFQNIDDYSWLPTFVRLAFDPGHSGFT